MRARNIGLGCLVIPTLALIIGIGVFGAAFIMGPITVSPTNKTLQQPIPWATSADSSHAGATLPPVAFGDRVLDVLLRFEEGSFEIVPGLPGEAIHLEAEYDEGAYSLTPHYEADSAGDSTTDRFELIFERTASLAGLRQLVHRREDLQDNHVRVFLPPGVPIRLEVEMSKGEAQFDFSGLSLVALRLATRMGSTQVEIDRQNPVPMELLDLRSEMGEMRFHGIGFAAPAAIHFKGRMGGYLLDFEGGGRPQVEARFEITMGDLRVEVPPEVTVDVTRQQVLLGEMESRGDRARRSEGNGSKRLSIEAKVRLGNLILD
jgi:hypothetical protein